MKKWFWVFSLSLALLLAACGGGGGGSQKAAGGAFDLSHIKATVEPPAAYKEKGKLVVGTDDTYEPMEYRDGDKIVGFDIDLITALAKKMGLEAEIISTEWDGLLPSLTSKRVDAVISSMNITEERAKEVNFVEYVKLSQVIVAKKGDTSIKGLEDLSDKIVAVQIQTTSEEIAMDYAKEVKSFNSFQDTFLELKAGRVDAIIIDEPVGAGAVMNDPDAFEIVADATGRDPVGIALHKEHTDLQAAMAQALEELRAEGVLKQLSEHWFGEDLFDR